MQFKIFGMFTRKNEARSHQTDTQLEPMSLSTIILCAQ